MAKEKSSTKQETASSRGTFTSRIGYVLAVAGSAIGLGNIWRFPYLAAKYGGGMFLLVYLILVVVFGYTLIVSETAMGRMTGKSPVGAFQTFGKKFPFKFGGWLNAIIPMLIVPYYSVIGGWVTKYLFEYLRGKGPELATDAYFGNFIADSFSSELWFIIFCVAVFVVILGGVEKGIERVSKIMMPLLFLLAIVVTIYSVTRPGALEGVKYFLVPNFKNFSLKTIVAAMGQMFYSLSIAMGILYTYGSYMKKDVDIEKSTGQICFFDTSIAILAGLMIIPGVFVFSGGSEEALTAGPSLMFVTIPKVLESMKFGTVAGIMFFLLVLLAALTSAISLMETSVSTFVDELGWSRKRSCLLMALITLVLGSASSLGFGVWDNIKIFGLSILDFFDSLTNNIMLPIAACATCILIIRHVTLKKIEDEVVISSKFRLKKLYNFCMKYIAIPFLILILITAILQIVGLLKI